MRRREHCNDVYGIFGLWDGAGSPEYKAKYALAIAEAARTRLRDFDYAE